MIVVEDDWAAAGTVIFFVAAVFTVAFFLAAFLAGADFFATGDCAFAASALQRPTLFRGSDDCSPASGGESLGTCFSARTTGGRGFIKPLPMGTHPEISLSNFSGGGSHRDGEPAASAQEALSAVRLRPLDSWHPRH